MMETVLNRRRAIALVGGGLAMMSMIPGALAVPRSTLFNVFRKGSLIGTHAIDFAGTDGRLQVTSRLDLAVKVAFITAYRYEQIGEDVWEDDVLVQTRIKTNDDGEDSLVVAEARDGKLAVTGPTGNYDTALGAMTDLSFWNQAITRGQPLIDSQNGELIKIEVKAGHSGADRGSGPHGRRRALRHGRDQGAVGHGLVRCRRQSDQGHRPDARRDPELRAGSLAGQETQPVRAGGDIAPVGQLQVRDHRQRQEGQLQDRLGHGAAAGGRGRTQRAQSGLDEVEVAIAHQARHRQRQVGQHPARLHHHGPTLQADQMVDRHRHVGLVVPGHDQVVAVVADAGGDGPAQRPEARDPASADVAIPPVPLEHGQLEGHALVLAQRQMVGDQ